MACASDPDGLAAGAGALPGARRRCEAGKRTHGPGPRACLALLAATALLALAAPAQAQPTTVTQSGDGATWSLVGENTVAAGQQTYTYTLTRTSGSLPLNEYFGFTSDTLEAERFQDGYSDCTGTNYFCFTLSNSYSYSEYTVSNVRFAGRILRDTSPHVLTLKVATGTPAGTTVTLGVVRRSGVPRSGGLQITVGTAPTNTAPTVANTIPNQTATAGTAFSYAFLANTFADTDPGDTLTYTATQSDDTALPSWLSFAAATRTFSGTPTAADVGTVSVKVTASDGHGGSVSDTFDIVVSAAPNTLATGAPTITGTAQVGQTLTAVTTGITDADGLTSPTYTYQWIRVDGTDEEDISGENSSTYILVDADLGTTIKVKVSFTDDANNPETLTSAATAAVSAAANTLATGAPTITGTAQVGQTLTAGTTAIMDADGLTSVSYTYQWIGVATDNTETNISSATASTYTLVAADQGTTVKVTVSFTDDANNPETRTSAATATVSAAANTLATGAPTITGTAQVGQTLTAGTTAIMDADGLTSVSYTYQWIGVATDNTETNISSATASTYILVAADLGTTLKVRVTFADDLGHTETRTSAATATVTATPAVPTREPFEVDIVGVPEVAVAGESYELTAQSDEDSLVYAWRVDSGAIEPDDVQMVVWTAPETAGVAWIHVDVTREDGAKAGQSAYVRVEVPEPEPEPVPALPLLGQLLLALGLAGAGAMRLVRAARRP